MCDLLQVANPSSGWLPRVTLVLLGRRDRRETMEKGYVSRVMRPHLPAHVLRVWQENHTWNAGGNDIGVWRVGEADGTMRGKARGCANWPPRTLR